MHACHPRWAASSVEATLAPFTCTGLPSSSPILMQLDPGVTPTYHVPTPPPRPGSVLQRHGFGLKLIHTVCQNGTNHAPGLQPATRTAPSPATLQHFPAALLPKPQRPNGYHRSCSCHDTHPPTTHLQQGVWRCCQPPRRLPHPLRADAAQRLAPLLRRARQQRHHVRQHVPARGRVRQDVVRKALHKRTPCRSSAIPTAAHLKQSPHEPRKKISLSYRYQPSDGPGLGGDELPYSVCLCVPYCRTAVRAHLSCGLPSSTKPYRCSSASLDWLP